MRMPKMSLTTPNMTSPTMQRAIYPNQATKVMRVEPTAESNLHQVCVMLMFVAILPWFKFICGSGNWREVLVSSPFCRSLFRHFFLRLPVASVVSFQVLFKGGEAGNTRFFGINTTQRRGDFSENRRLDLLFPKPAAIPLHLHDNDWCQRKDHVEERKSERQMKIETSRKFLDCTIIAYSFLRNGYNYCLANVFREMEIAYKNGIAFREIPLKEEYGLSMLLASGFLQGCADKHESGHWCLRRWLLSCGGICKQNCTANQGMVFLLIG